ncbi:MAG TPA: DUF2974 domain-containing protein [Dokdonella sp.]|nr:DUF2974 domain-containing protein [Dokdonella sp.]
MTFRLNNRCENSAPRQGIPQAVSPLAPRYGRCRGWQSEPGVMTFNVSGIDNSTLSPPQQAPSPPPPPPPQYDVQSRSGGLPEPTYHPQAACLTQPGPCAGDGGPYALPAGSTLAEVAGGTQAQPFDVTLSQLATAVYGTRGGPPAGWNEVSDADIAQRLGLPPNDPATAAAVQSWREEFLGGGEQTKAQQFKAEIYTDGCGNYVLSYRGTAEGRADWNNNFTQGTGFTTHGVDDKFSGTAVNTAMEFKRLFADSATPTNLAITGHSQGGGLAAVGSLAADIPAVTFDASGIHPNTLARMGFTPGQARDYAENGGIRAYSLKSDLLTQVQETGVVGLVAPDALGTPIVVEPGLLARHDLVERTLDVEANLPGVADWAINRLVESMRHSSIPVLSDIGKLAYGAASHSPNALTAAMIEREPWQPGYSNPIDTGKALQDLVPEPLKDDFAINTHDFISDAGEVIRTDFANGNPVQGLFRIGGDFVEGFWNSAGDTLNRGAESLSQALDKRVGGVPGAVLSRVIDFGGNVAHGVADAVGTFAEATWNVTGAAAQKAVDVVDAAKDKVIDFAKGLFGR